MSVALSLALETFKSLQYAEKRVDKLTQQLHSHVVNISSEEMDEYVRLTKED